MALWPSLFLCCLFPFPRVLVCFGLCAGGLGFGAFCVGLFDGGSVSFRQSFPPFFLLLSSLGEVHRFLLRLCRLLWLVCGRGLLLRLFLLAFCLVLLSLCLSSGWVLVGGILGVIVLRDVRYLVLLGCFLFLWPACCILLPFFHSLCHSCLPLWWLWYWYFALVVGFCSMLWFLPGLASMCALFLFVVSFLDGGGFCGYLSRRWYGRFFWVLLVVCFCLFVVLRISVFLL